MYHHWQFSCYILWGSYLAFSRELEELWKEHGSGLKPRAMTYKLWDFGQINSLLWISLFSKMGDSVCFVELWELNKIIQCHVPCLTLNNYQTPKTSLLCSIPPTHSVCLLTYACFISSSSLTHTSLLISVSSQCLSIYEILHVPIISIFWSNMESHVSIWVANF